MDDCAEADDALGFVDFNAASSADNKAMKAFFIGNSPRNGMEYVLDKYYQTLVIE